MKFKYSLGIVIPVYNMEKYLKECLESVVNQTSPFDEVILINDGSFDNSRKICEEYCNQYAYFQLINQENKGSGAARNLGMKYISSDYFIFLDADDYITLSAVDIIKNKLNSQDILFYASGVKEDIDGVIHSNTYIRDQLLCNYTMSGMNFFFQSFPKKYIVSACMSAYKKSFVESYNIKFLEGLYYEDDFFYLETITKARIVECISEQLYVRRYRTGSIMTSDIDKKRCLDKMLIQFKIWDYINLHLLNEQNNGFFCGYLLSGISRVMWMVEQCERKKEIEEQEILFLEKFMEHWGGFCKKSLIYLNDYFIFLKVYKKIICNDKIYRMEYEEVKRLFIKEIKKKLNRLCLNEPDAKIGIYGMGEHTKAMFALYKKYIGKIRCDYFYILSEKPQINMINQGHLMVFYKCIPKDVDLIIISSLVYMNDMVKNLNSEKIDHQKIFQLYHPNESLDLVTAYNFIENEMNVF